MSHGGSRTGAGRKSKDEELKIIELLDKAIDRDLPAKKLNELIKKGNLRALELYYAYMYGKPRAEVDLHIGTDFLATLEVTPASESKKKKD